MSERLVCLDRGPTRSTESVKLWRNLMKKVVVGFLFSFILTLSTSAIASPYGHAHRHAVPQHRHWHHNYGWVVPALISGAVVYAATRPEPVIVQQPTIVLQPNQVIIDGIIYNKQVMIINGVQQEVLIRAQ